MSSGPGVDAVYDGSSVVHGPHIGSQQELYSGMPVSTRDCPAGEWLTGIRTHINRWFGYDLFAHGLLRSQGGVCVSESDCRCDVGGEQYNPGDTVPLDCSNW